MKYFTTLIILFSSCFNNSQTLNYKQWNKEAKTDIRLLPKYGNIPKNGGQKLADEQLIESYVSQEGSREKASEVLIDIGFQYLYRRDPRTAMSRFNQAWLLNPENTDVFWGWGAVYFFFQDIPKTLEQYDQGLQLNPSNSRILTDKATVLMSKFRDSKDSTELHRAIGLFSKSYAIDSTNQNTSFKLSVAYFESRDCVNARKFYDICKRLGGKPISAAYTEAIKRDCKE